MGIFYRFLKPNVKKLKEKRDIQRLSEALSHKDRDVRTSAADALGEIGDKTAIDALIRALSDENSHVRELAITSLGKTNDTRAIQPLTTALSDEYSGVREKASTFLIHMGEIDRVIKAVEDRNEKVRQSAAKALGETKNNDAIRPLIKALDDNNDEVREEVAKALRHFETAEAKEALRGYEVRQREVKIAKLGYVVGRHLVKDGVYKKQIGTEKIGYFDPLKVVFRLFDEQGRRITADGNGATTLVWPPDCGSKEEQMIFMMMGPTLAQALEAYPSQISGFYMMSNPLGELGKLLLNLLKVGDSEAGKLIYESTVLPFFQRYSAGEKSLIIDEVFREVMLNALFNFLCSEVVRPPGVEDIGTDKLKRRATEIVRQIRDRTTT
jgi:HEAT repeats